jgi:hypothetical protein
MQAGATHLRSFRLHARQMVLAARRREAGHGPRRIVKAFKPIKRVPGYREREFVSSVVQGTQFRFLIRT